MTRASAAQWLALTVTAERRIPIELTKRSMRGAAAFKWSTKMQMHSMPCCQDPVSSFTHLLAVPVFLVLSFYLLQRGRGNRARVLFLGIFAFASVFLLTMSGLYHMMSRHGTARSVMERLDHGAIFVLIAGTFTPTYGILCRDGSRWKPLVLIWSLTLVALCLKIILFSQMPEWLGLTIYLSLGWLGTLSAIALWRRFGRAFVRPLIWGGIAYTVGSLLEFWKWPIVISGVVGPHEFFHLLVLVGMGCHWKFMFQFASGLRSEHCQPYYDVSLETTLPLPSKIHTI